MLNSFYSGKVRRSKIRKVSSAVVIVNHLGGCSSPSTDCRAVNMCLYTQADEGMSRLVTFAVRNATFG